LKAVKDAITSAVSKHDPDSDFVAGLMFVSVRLDLFGKELQDKLDGEQGLVVLSDDPPHDEVKDVLIGIKEVLG